MPASFSQIISVLTLAISMSEFPVSSGGLLALTFIMNTGVSLYTCSLMADLVVRRTSIISRAFLLGVLSEVIWIAFRTRILVHKDMDEVQFVLLWLWISFHNLEIFCFDIIIGRAYMLLALAL